MLPFQASKLSTLGPFTVTTTNANVPLYREGVAVTVREGQLRVVNSGTGNARLAFGTDNTAAVTTPVPNAQTGATYTAPTPGSPLVLAGSIEVFSIPPGSTHVAFKCDSGSTTLELTAGLGE